MIARKTKACRKSVQRKKVALSKISVCLILAQVFLYTWVHLILSYLVGVEIAPTVSVAFYGFCGAEAGLLAWIKNTKIKKESGVSSYETDDFEQTFQP